MEREGAQALRRAAVAEDGAGEGGEEQETAGGEGVAPGGGWACWRGRGLDNVFCERRWRSVEYDNIYLQQYDSVRQLQAGLRDDFDCTTTGDRVKVSTFGLQLKSTSCSDGGRPPVADRSGTHRSGCALFSLFVV